MGDKVSSSVSFGVVICLVDFIDRGIQCSNDSLRKECHIRTYVSPPFLNRKFVRNCHFPLEQQNEHSMKKASEWRRKDLFVIVCFVRKCMPLLWTANNNKISVSGAYFESHMRSQIGIIHSPSVFSILQESIHPKDEG